MPENTEKSSKPEPGSGIRSTRTTGVFRAVNFELFAAPVSSTKSSVHVCIACCVYEFIADICPTEKICDDNRSSVYDILCQLSPLLEQHLRV